MNSSSHMHDCEWCAWSVTCSAQPLKIASVDDVSWVVIGITYMMACSGGHVAGIHVLRRRSSILCRLYIWWDSFSRGVRSAVAVPWWWCTCWWLMRYIVCWLIRYPISNQWPLAPTGCPWVGNSACNQQSIVTSVQLTEWLKSQLASTWWPRTTNWLSCNFNSTSLRTPVDTCICMTAWRQLHLLLPLFSQRERGAKIRVSSGKTKWS